MVEVVELLPNPKGDCGREEDGVERDLPAHAESRYTPVKRNIIHKRTLACKQTGKYATYPPTNELQLTPMSV